MVMPGMVLSDWVSMVMCSCGHLASWHMLHPPVAGTTNPVLGSCKDCLPIQPADISGCDGFTPRTMDDAEKLTRALGLNEPDEQLEKQIAEKAQAILDMPGMAVADQPMPKGTGREIFPLVVADLEERRQYGIRTYGEGLTAHNGRDALQDIYQELLDAVVYIRQEIEERDRQLERNQALLAEQVE